MHKILHSSLDTNYIKDYKKHLVGRLYTSHKYTHFSVITPNTFEVLNYRPKTTITGGIGATYGGISLNLAYPLPEELNPFNENVKTKYLDIQLAVCLPKFNIDVFYENYHGMFIQETDTYDASIKDGYYTRPDISALVLGFSGYHVFNHEKFSFAASEIQNQQQLKSAGSVMLGLDFNYSKIKGDSAFIPNYVGTDTSLNVKQLNFFHLGPGLGYAHNFIIFKKFFFMISVIGHIGIGSYTERNEENIRKNYFNIDPGVVLKNSFGYNHKRWYFGFVHFKDTFININGKESFSNILSIGRIRIILAHRFDLSKKTKDKIDHIIPDL